MKPITVSQLNNYVKKVLCENEHLKSFPIKGEVTDYKRKNEGHIYFTLKDSETGFTVPCAMWQNNVTKDIRENLKEGEEIICDCSVNFWADKARFSLTIKKIEMQNKIGDIYKQFLELKNKLEKEGLFDEAHKKSIPFLPLHIGIVSSVSGAGLGDAVKIIQANNELVSLYLFDCLVQGESAPISIIKQIKKANLDYKFLDVLIVGRGGGAYEDLNCFNDENLARAVFESKIPIVSAVGHERDYTIIDFVADKRAETPTDAANSIVKNLDDIRFNLDHYLGLIKKKLASNIVALNDRLAGHSKAILSDKLKLKISNFEHRIKQMSPELQNEKLQNRLHSSNYDIDKSHERLKQSLNNKIQEKENKILHYYNVIEAKSPESILKRGYSYITKQGVNVSSVKLLKKGDTVNTVMADGKIDMEVK